MSSDNKTPKTAMAKAIFEWILNCFPFSHSIQIITHPHPFPPFLPLESLQRAASWALDYRGTSHSYQRGGVWAGQLLLLALQDLLEINLWRICTFCCKFLWPYHSGKQKSQLDRTIHTNYKFDPHIFLFLSAICSWSYCSWLYSKHHWVFLISLDHFQRAREWVRLLSI